MALFKDINLARNTKLHVHVCVSGCVHECIEGTDMCGWVTTKDDSLYSMYINLFNVTLPEDSAGASVFMVTLRDYEDQRVVQAALH